MLVLPLVPVTATMTRGWLPARPGSKLRETAPRLWILQQRPRRHARRPLRTSRREHGDGTSRHRIGDEGTTVNATARQRREEITGGHVATVRGDAGNFQATRIPPGGGNGTGQSLYGNRAHDFSEPQRGRLRLRAVQRRQLRSTPAYLLRGVARGPSGAQARAGSQGRSTLAGPMLPERKPSTVRARPRRPVMGLAVG